MWAAHGQGPPTCRTHNFGLDIMVPVFVTLAFSIPISKDNVTDVFLSKVIALIIAAISLAAGISNQRIAISIGSAAKRGVSAE